MKEGREEKERTRGRNGEEEAKLVDSISVLV